MENGRRQQQYAISVTIIYSWKFVYLVMNLHYRYFGSCISNRVTRGPRYHYALGKNNCPITHENNIVMSKYTTHTYPWKTNKLSSNSLRGELFDAKSSTVIFMIMFI